MRASFAVLKLFAVVPGSSARSDNHIQYAQAGKNMMPSKKINPTPGLALTLPGHAST